MITKRRIAFSFCNNIPGTVPYKCILRAGVMYKTNVAQVKIAIKVNAPPALPAVPRLRPLLLFGIRSWFTAVGETRFDKVVLACS
jgi:hypothetical protein